MPEPLYHSPRGLYQFQADHVAYTVLRPNNLLAWETGLGKTHGAMATAAILFEDDLIDIMVLVAERNKVREWMDDFATFTRLTVGRYDGSPTKRRKLLDDLPQVLVTTYETARQDMVLRDGVDPRKLSDGPMTTALLNKRVFIAYDEMAKLGNRDSLLHRAHHHAIKAWRASGECRVLGLTATPMERNPENYYNLGRILTPSTMGTVKEFYRQHVADYDLFGNPNKFRNLPQLAEKMSSVLLRKRKSDPDVRDQFPKMVERFTYVELGKDHRRFYDEVDAYIKSQEDPLVEQVGFGLLRQIAGHPLSIMESEGELGATLAAQMGEEALRKLGSAKTDCLTEYLSVISEQGAQAVVFTYYVSVLLQLEQAIKKAGVSVTVNHGRLSDATREANKAAFKRGEFTVFLTSTAGERGINLPEATYVVNYDLPTKHTSYVQRLNRISRIGSITSDTIVAKSFIAAGTVEEGIANLWLGRNYQNDVLLDSDVDEAEDDTFLSSTDRRALLRAANVQARKEKP